MSKPWRATDVEDGTLYDLDNLSTQRWLEGHVPGAETAAGWLRQQAVKLFEAGDDEQAVFLRDMANKMLVDLIPKLRIAAATHDKEFSYRGKK